VSTIRAIASSVVPTRWALSRRELIVWAVNAGAVTAQPESGPSQRLW
jgi:hypothetical protein